MRTNRRRSSRRRRNKSRRINALARPVIDQISAASAGRDRVVVAFAVEEIVAAVSEKLIAPAGGLRAVGSKIAVDVIDREIVARAADTVAINHIVICAAQQQIG